MISKDRIYVRTTPADRRIRINKYVDARFEIWMGYRGIWTSGAM